MCVGGYVTVSPSWLWIKNTLKMPVSARLPEMVTLNTKPGSLDIGDMAWPERVRVWLELHFRRGQNVSEVIGAWAGCESVT